MHYCDGEGGMPVGYYVVCSGCCAGVGTFGTEEEAISAWNSLMKFGTATPTHFEKCTKDQEALADLILKVQRYATEGITPYSTKESVVWWLNQKEARPPSGGRGYGNE